MLINRYAFLVLLFAVHSAAIPFSCHSSALQQILDTVCVRTGQNSVDHPSGVPAC